MYNPSFDENNPRYTVCCCHARTWAWAIGIVEAIGLIVSLVSSIISYSRGGYYYYENDYSKFTTFSSIIGGTVGTGIGAIIVILFLYGLKNERHRFLIPHMVFEVISIILLIIGAVGNFVMAGLIGSKHIDINVVGINSVTVAISTSTEPWYRDPVSLSMTWLISSGGGMLIAALISAFFFRAVYRAYRYLKEKQEANVQAMTGHINMVAKEYV